MIQADLAAHADATTGAAPTIRIRGATKWFYKAERPVKAFEDVSFDVPEGSFTALVGPSGCGKSTILNCVAGLQSLSSGSVMFKGREVRSINVGVGYMTQKDSLLPWRTVLDGIALPLQVRGMRRAERRRKAAEYVARLRLGGFENHYPSELSGGMLKRAALARTLIFEPDTLLMDEPFGNLDAQLKLQLQRDLMSLASKERRTIVFVSHDLEEAIALADWIVVLSRRPGRVKEIIGVDLPRPRDPVSVRFEPAFQAIHRRLWNLIDASLEN